MSNLSEKFKELKVSKHPLHIYQLAPPEADDRQLNNASRQLGLRADLKTGTFLQDAGKIMYTEGPFEVTVYRASGAVKYRNKSSYQVDDGKSAITFEPGEAEGLAREYIRKNKLAPLKELELFKISQLHVAHMERDTGKGEERVIGAGVIFARLIDGLPVDGPGGKVVVHLNTQKEVTGCEYSWRKLQKVKSVIKKLQPLEFIEKAVRDFVKPEPGMHLEVNDLRLGYFEEDAKHEQKYLQPAYVIILTISSEKSERVLRKKTVLVLPAATNHAGAIMKERPKRPETHTKRG